MAYTGHPYRQRDIYSMLQTISATPYSRGVNGRTCIGVSLRNSCVNYPRRESNPHLRFRKPPFCPLNYGDDDICDFRFPIADCKWWTRALTPMFGTKIKSLRLLFFWLSDLI